MSAPRRASRRRQPAAAAGEGVHVVDSSGWLEYLADTDRAHLFAPAIEDREHLVVPVVSLYEVFQKALREHGQHIALQVAALMQQGRVVEVDAALAMKAATLALPLADSLIYATARDHSATLWTQDVHFEGLEGVRYFQKRASTAG